MTDRQIITPFPMRVAAYCPDSGNSRFPQEVRIWREPDAVPEPYVRTVETAWTSSGHEVTVVLPENGGDRVGARLIFRNAADMVEFGEALAAMGRPVAALPHPEPGRRLDVSDDEDDIEGDADVPA
jgi:hypothetical protein